MLGPQETKVAALLRQVRPQPEIVTLGERRLWLAMLHGLAKVLLAKASGRDLLKFIRLSGGTKW